MWTPTGRRPHGRAVLLVALAVLGLGGCSQEEAQIPELAGPSELALSIEMKAAPSILNADGASRASVTATVRDHAGRPAANQGLFCQHDGDGLLYATGQVLGALQTGVAVATDTSGTARLIYQAGTEPGRLVSIGCKPYSDGAGSLGTVPRLVVIEQR